MTLNDTLAKYSDWSFEAAFAVVVLAMLLLVIEYATYRSKLVAERELVAAGGVGSSPAETVPGRVENTTGRTLSERFGNMGRALVVVAAALMIASIVLRGLATERFPLGNMYEFVAMACTAAIVFSLVMLRKPAYRILWVYVLAPVAVLMFVAATVLYADAAPVVPALRSFWLPIHVTIISVGSGIFLLAGAASVLFLLRIHQQGFREGRARCYRSTTARRPGARPPRLPDHDRRLPTVRHRYHSRRHLAEAAWGRFWGWDPKETVSFITWVIYAAYLHARATSGWRNTRAAWINVAGFVAMLFNLFIINMVVSGLHSYAGLN